MSIMSRCRKCAMALTIQDKMGGHDKCSSCRKKEKEAQEAAAAREQDGS